MVPAEFSLGCRHSGGWEWQAVGVRDIVWPRYVGAPRGVWAWEYVSVGDWYASGG